MNESGRRYYSRCEPIGSVPFGSRSSTADTAIRPVSFATTVISREPTRHNNMMVSETCPCLPSIRHNTVNVLTPSAGIVRGSTFAWEHEQPLITW